MADSLLKLENVTAGYGDAVVLHGISLDLPEHGSLALLGRNGVGKSTLLMTIMGYTQLRSGRVVWKGQDISRLSPNRRAVNGIGWVAQEREIFPSLSVEENLTVASRAGPWDLDAVFKLFPRLSERRRNMGNQLSGGEQQMLAIARALMTNPALMLLDEPFEGLAPVIVDELTAAMKMMLSDRRIAIILVEQHTDIALELTAEAIVLERGAVAHRAPSLSCRKTRPHSNAWLGCAWPQRHDILAAGKVDTGRGHVQSDDSARTFRLLGDRGSPAAQVTGQGPHRVLDHRQLRSVGHSQTNGATAAARPDRRPADAGRGALGLP
jgi:branched-chain amino acid transport system ATP-binding protein